MEKSSKPPCGRTPRAHQSSAEPLRSAVPATVPPSQTAANRADRTVRSGRASHTAHASGAMALQRCRLMLPTSHAPSEARKRAGESERVAGDNTPHRVPHTISMHTDCRVPGVAQHWQQATRGQVWELLRICLGTNPWANRSHLPTLTRHSHSARALHATQYSTRLRSKRLSFHRHRQPRGDV